MLENLIYCLNATVPIFGMMLIGLFLCKIGLMDIPFANKISGFVFKVALPVMVFQDMAESDFYSVWDGTLVVFCFVSSLLTIVIAALCSRGMKGIGKRGEFIQGSYRSSIALLGVAFLQNLYGDSGAAALVIIGAVPLYNMSAVIILALTKPDGGAVDRTMIQKALKGIVTNPIIIAIILGVAWSLLEIPQPTVLESTLNSVAATATPLGLMALGATFQMSKVMEEWKSTVLAVAFKLVIFAAVFIPVAVALGMRDAKLVSVLAMLAGPTTVSAFVMAKGMGHEGTISTAVVMLSTLCSAFTLTLWLYILRSMGFI